LKGGVTGRKGKFFELLSLGQFHMLQAIEPVHLSMKLLFTSRLTLTISLTLLAAAASLRAEFIQPVAVEASNGQASQDALINGQGFDADPGIGSPTSIHNRLGSEMWSAVGSIKEYVVFDLGTNISLAKIYIWNYNVQDATDVGMKEVEVQVSSDTNIASANFNAIAQISLAQGGQAAQPSTWSEPACA